MSRVALTGATGLLGGATRARLEAAGHGVVVVGRRAGADVRADLADPASVAAIDLSGCRALVHCAGITDEDTRTDLARAYAQSTSAWSALLDRARAGGVDTVAYVSTSHVYGPPVGAIDEASPLAPVTDYAVAHAAAELVLRRHAATGGLRALIARPNAVFGTPTLETFDRWALIPFAFVRAAVQAGEITLRSAGTQRRNLVAAEDVADDLVAFVGDPGAPGVRVVNPLGAESMSVAHFARRVADVATRALGRRVTVSLPAAAATEPGADFDYRTLHPTTRPRRSLDEAVTSLCQLLAKAA